MRLIPIVVLVDDATEATLRPVVDDLAARMESGNVLPPLTRLMNGWTYESLAWGKVLAASAAADIELEVVAP